MALVLMLYALSDPRRDGSQNWPPFQTSDQRVLAVDDFLQKFESPVDERALLLDMRGSLRVLGSAAVNNTPVPELRWQEALSCFARTALDCLAPEAQSVPEGATGSWIQVRLLPSATCRTQAAEAFPHCGDVSRTTIGPYDEQILEVHMQGPSVGIAKLLPLKGASELETSGLAVWCNTVDPGEYRVLLRLKSLPLLPVHGGPPYRVYYGDLGKVFPRSGFAVRFIAPKVGEVGALPPPLRQACTTPATAGRWSPRWASDAADGRQRVVGRGSGAGMAWPIDVCSPACNDGTSAQGWVWRPLTCDVVHTSREAFDGCRRAIGLRQVVVAGSKTEKPLYSALAAFASSFPPSSPEPTHVAWAPCRLPMGEWLDELAQRVAADPQAILIINPTGCIAEQNLLPQFAGLLHAGTRRLMAFQARVFWHVPLPALAVAMGYFESIQTADAYQRAGADLAVQAGFELLDTDRIATPLCGRAETALLIDRPPRDQEWPMRFSMLALQLLASSLCAVVHDSSVDHGGELAAPPPNACARHSEQPGREPPFSPARAVLVGKRLRVIGDSIARYVFRALAFLIEGRLVSRQYGKHADMDIQAVHPGSSPDGAREATVLEFEWRPFTHRLLDETSGGWRCGAESSARKPMADVVLINTGLWDMLHIHDAANYSTSVRRIPLNRP